MANLHRESSRRTDDLVMAQIGIPARPQLSPRPERTGPLGRAVRLAAGVLGLAFVGQKLSAVGAGEVAATLGWAAALAVGYLAVVVGLARARVGPWPASAVLLAPLLVYPIGVGSPAFHVGLSLYLEVSLVVAAMVGYRGAEVAVLPDLVRRARLASRTPSNVVDLLEDLLPAGLPAASRVHRRASRVAAGLGIAAMAYFWTVPTMAGLWGPVGAAAEAVTVTQPAWSAALLVAAALVLVAARRRALPLAALLALLAVLSEIGMVPDLLWGLVVLAGVGVAVRDLVRRRSVPARPAPAEFR